MSNLQCFMTIPGKITQQNILQSHLKKSMERQWGTRLLPVGCSGINKSVRGNGFYFKLSCLMTSSPLIKL